MIQETILTDMSWHLKSLVQGQIAQGPKEVNFQEAGMSNPRHIYLSVEFRAVVAVIFPFKKK